MSEIKAAVLRKLGELERERMSTDDLRGKHVFDRNGADVGTVDGLLIDDVERKVRVMRVRCRGSSPRSAARFLVPVEAIASVGECTIWIAQTLERVAAAPSHAAAMMGRQELVRELYRYYGYPPFWDVTRVSSQVPWFAGTRGRALA